ncbi:catalase [Glaciimonas sp. CA11.2]|uniref:catalase n=1 Tax=Glaciimonas sp. CA11.2 TaxID=3048601 RepID=UPI002AB48CE1|nr:catalase [Glaciimonas sp. CA11.2]MDY7547144.1 catalase [Glaciimonas sp. CA11.2]MEB0164850.1 catalase [Glaciimonas sp. CA11.2]
MNDGTAVWPNDRPQIALGILSLTTMAPDSAAIEKTLTFNPLLLVDGIAPSADPILLARQIAYSFSVRRRFSGQ